MKIGRPLGTMVAFGFPRGDVGVDLAIALDLSASLLEILPDWRADPNPILLRSRVADAGLTVHSVHGCWGGRAIRAERVDLGSIDPTTWRSSVDDLRLALDWASAAGASCLVVHPGGFSEAEDAPARGEALTLGLVALADHARGLGVTACVENMPTGVHPGSRMADIRAIVDAVDRPAIALALDTGHAQIASTPTAETLAAGPRLRTTHVHDNDGRRDSHLPPGLGVVDWDAWRAALDTIGYRGPIILECIRHLRDRPGSIDQALRDRLARLTGE